MMRSRSTRPFASPARLMPALVVASGLALAGCAATPKVGTDVVTTGMPNPETALRESIHLVDAEMTELGTLRTGAYASGTASGPAAADAGPVLPDELKKTVTLAFAGPLDEGVRKLAGTVGYTVDVVPSPDPKAPTVVVDVSTGFVTAFVAFRQLGEAAGSRAMVRVDPARHRVEVIHHA